MTSTRRGFVPIFAIISALALLVVSASACLDDSITGLRELSMVLTSDRTIVSVGDSVNFEYSAEGTGLVSVRVEYGDGGEDFVLVSSSGGFEEPEEGFRADTLFYPGPIGVRGPLTHAFDSVGTFLVIGYAVGAAGVASDTVALTVN